MNKATCWQRNLWGSAKHNPKFNSKKKKKAYSEEKLKQNINNFKEIWKTLKQAGLPDKMSNLLIFA